ncbi:Asp-tRNA(Asn)/Glu-tRNA(Gln) amidotransferase subunit GatC [Rickettsiales bacterium]|nr:Asp-tRNA(Asn)/Glu-tRNA(Gln) amidotransferase subunit GatC [Rickettsiales bacterium]
MSLSEKEVRKIARLSRIKLSDEEITRFQGELSGVIDWVELLQEVNTDNVPRMTSVTDSSQPLREDKVNDGGIQDQVLANSPKSSYGCFVVPKVVE